MSRKVKGNQWLYSSLGHHHIAGHGCIEDDYSETSGCKNYAKHEAVRLPHDNIDPSRMNGEVIIVQEGRKKDGK